MLNRRLVRLLTGVGVTSVCLMATGVAWAICHPTLNTMASSGMMGSPATVGQPITDTAFLSSGQSETGTITWTVYSSADTSCSTPLFTTAPVTVNGNGTYVSPPYTPTSPGSYQWIASYSGDWWNAAVTTPCNDPHEQSVLSMASPTISTSASSGTAGQPLTDSATLSGGYMPSGSITWTVYSSSDTSCTTPLFTSSPVTVGGDGTYTSPSYTPTSAGTYQWVAMYSGDANNNSIMSSCNDPNEQSSVAATPPPSPPAPATPGISVVKLQRVGSTGSFKSTTVTAKVGRTIDYEIVATNTGNTPLTLSLSDPLCNAGTIKGPFPVSGTLTGDVLSPGGVADYTCSHVLKSSDPSPFTNTATVTGTPPSGPAVQGTAKATAKKRSVKAITALRCKHGKVKKYKKVHGKKVAMCVTKKKVSGVVRRRTPSFTG